ncbi:hypothetical protein SAMN05216489_01869 [Streptomyces sp. 3213]|uniref:hypothetical protein n=1 Tax=Streptomyces sp. 3213.3 TaxID=1855348 RepID=UPI000894D3B9|nr:hypothetical protein [Streptomyces sp. 3213.3]SEC88197.1 hypothetical protein SAMN05216489_01869 [Streptomyces sp. 3213] [Streptomyces sp. 3213.3]
MATPTTTCRDRLVCHLAEVANWILGAEHDVSEFERQLAEADQHLSNATRQCEAAIASARAILSTGPDSVTFRREIDRQVATCEAAILVRVNATNLHATQQALDTLKAKQANAKTTLLQAQALRQRLQLAEQADELPSVTDELEALLED